ncbi:protein FAM111A-like [Stegastes partitus]|uniref:Protein FAM111A-like n=1 Tax=Stegastes partitus TaxID=144197 RepID=A0A3B4ZXY2_9TELE|nr:PREDICTED: protein FAM111A-like [Stegastes partitus]XP_008286840.1 PREDICTED: protein FAM111A-like [Stegastes partitus]
MTTTNDEPAEKRKKTESDSGESSPPPNVQPVAQEEEPHPTHSFEWRCHGKTSTTITCNKAGTVEDVLKRSSLFKQLAAKYKDKELVILKDFKAISSHFPCSLIKNERLTLKYVKAVNKPGKAVSQCVSSRKKGPSSELVMFHVLAKGGKNVVKILKNPALKTNIQELTVYAYKGEKVKQALKRDGRFLSTIFGKNCALSEKSTEVNTEMSNLVDDLDGKTYQIILLDKSSPPASQSSSLDDAYMTQSDSQGNGPDESQDSSQQSTTTDSENNNLPEKKSKLHGVRKPENVLREIPYSKKLQIQLISKFNNSMNSMKTQVPKLSRIQNLLRVEYGKNADTCREVKTMKKLMELSDSVCQVRINQRPAGSGFLLFDNFVLTNAHVIKDIYSDTRRKLDKLVTVNFCYESLEQTEGRSVKVEEVVGIEYCPDVSPCDWALLRLGANENLPRGLLPHFGFLPKSGAICIIGHPDSGVKQIDPCLIVPTENRIQVVERHYWDNQEHIQLITKRFFEDVANYVQQHSQVLTYETGFYDGSSGSPVFDKHCNVVAMHSGGFSYEGTSGKNSVIEFGHPLSGIIEHMILQMGERRRFNELKGFLACRFAQRQEILINVKKLVESRNPSVNINDQSLKMMFELFSQVEEPVPMEIN